MSTLIAPRSPRYESLDLCRGIACLMVVVFHAVAYVDSDPNANVASMGAWSLAVAKQLWIGVPIFFVISGYCISATADKARRGRHAMGHFFLRRFRRIFPPYWIALGLSCVLVSAVETWLSPGLFTDEISSVAMPWSLTAGQWVGNVTLMEGWRPRIFGPESSFQLGPAWTLAYEEQFYLVTGLLLLAAPTRLFRGAAIVSGLTVAIWLAARRWGFSVDGFFFDGRWLLFAAGVLVYHQLNYGTRIQQWLVNGFFLLCAGYFATFPSRHAPEVGDLHQSALVASVFALGILLMQPWDEWLSSLAALRPLRFCGTICYSLYLVHGPIVSGISHALELHGVNGTLPTLLVTVPVCLLVSLAAGWGFHLAVERKFLNSPQQIHRSSESLDAQSPAVEMNAFAGV